MRGYIYILFLISATAFAGGTSPKTSGPKTHAEDFTVVRQRVDAAAPTTIADLLKRASGVNADNLKNVVQELQSAEGEETIAAAAETVAETLGRQGVLLYVIKGELDTKAIGTTFEIKEEKLTALVAAMEKRLKASAPVEEEGVKQPVADKPVPEKPKAIEDKIPEPDKKPQANQPPKVQPEPITKQPVAPFVNQHQFNPPPYCTPRRRHQGGCEQNNNDWMQGFYFTMALAQRVQPYEPISPPPIIPPPGGGFRPQGFPVFAMPPLYGEVVISAQQAQMFSGANYALVAQQFSKSINASVEALSQAVAADGNMQLKILGQQLLTTLAQMRQGPAALTVTPMTSVSRPLQVAAVQQTTTPQVTSVPRTPTPVVPTTPTVVSPVSTGPRIDVFPRDTSSVAR